MAMHNPIVWFEIYVDDMERASKFYETIFNMTLDKLPNPNEEEMHMKIFPGNMEVYGANGALVKMNDVKAGGNSTVIYFGSKDCTTEEKHIERAGGKIVKPKMSIGPHGFITLFLDTEGNMIGLHSLK